MPRKSFLDCPHNNVQEFTECCMDCGHNIYKSKEQYLKELKEEAVAKGIDEDTKEIRRLETLLNIQ